MDFRGYLAAIGVKEIPSDQVIIETEKFVAGLPLSSRKKMKDSVKLFKESSTRNWMDHLNSAFAGSYDIVFSQKRLLKQYEDLVKKIDLGTEKKYIVDVGAGTGIATNYIALKNPDKIVIALDVSEGALRESMKKRNRLNLKNLEYVVCDARYMPLAGGLDPKICITRLSERNLPKEEYAGIAKEIKRIS